MADITYCDNNDCTCNHCERHPSKISDACLKGKGYVSVASFEGRCWRYDYHQDEPCPKDQ